MKMRQVIFMRNIVYLCTVAALIIGIADPANYIYEPATIKGIGYGNSTSTHLEPELVIGYSGGTVAIIKLSTLELLRKGEALAVQGKYDDAILAFDEAIRLVPEFADAWYDKGAALYGLGKYNEALQAFNQAISINPQYADAWNNKGVALKALGRTSEANAAFAKAEELKNAA